MNATFDIGPATEADSEAMSLALVFAKLLSMAYIALDI